MKLDGHIVSDGSQPKKEIITFGKDGHMILNVYNIIGKKITEGSEKWE